MELTPTLRAEIDRNFGAAWGLLTSEVTDRAKAIEAVGIAAAVVSAPDASVCDLEVAGAVLWAAALRLLVEATARRAESN
jgi:hypothetical protein